jgi:hypothetical protein
MNEVMDKRPMMEERADRPTGNGELTREYLPNKQQILRDYEVRIRFLSVGCIISVGCKEIPFTNVGEAMVELSRYVSNPHEEVKRWNNIFDSAE